MKCPTCNAIIDGEKPVILSEGNWSGVKHYNRVCKYALIKGKSCVNQIRISDDSLSWEAESKQFDKDFDNLQKYLIQES